jgi:hypothetical protein
MCEYVATVGDNIRRVGPKPVSFKLIAMGGSAQALPNKVEDTGRSARLALAQSRIPTATDTVRPNSGVTALYR